MDKEKFNSEKLKYLSRISEIDINLEKDIMKIIKFVECINKYNIEDKKERIYYGKEILDFFCIREDLENNNNNNNNVKKIINNFYEKEDDFCIVPIVIDK